MSRLPRWTTRCGALAWVVLGTAFVLPGRGSLDFRDSGAQSAEEPPGAVVQPATPPERRAIDIQHDPPGCLVAGRFPKLNACVAAPAEVAQARVHFRGDLGRHWYSVEMKPEGPCFSGVLPKPREQTRAILYYIVMLNRSFMEGRTPEHKPAVVRSAADCPADLITAPFVTSALVVLSAAAGVPVVPAGFASAGVVAGSSAGAAVGASTGSTGGGLSGTAIGVAAGAVAVAGVAVAAAEDEPAPTPVPSPACVTTTGVEYLISGGPDPTQGIFVDDYLRVFVNGQRVSEIAQGGGCCPPAPPVRFLGNTGDTLLVEAQDGNNCYSLGVLHLQKLDGSCSRQLTAGMHGPHCGSEPPMQVFFRETYVLP